jgi:isochorismate hydrolase
MFGHEFMKPMLSTFFSNLVKTKHNRLIVDIIKSGISTHITSSCTTKDNVAREFLHTLVTITLGFSKNASARMVAKKIRLSRKCVYQSLQQCLQIKDGALDFCTDIKKQQRSIALSTETRTLIIKWWTMETIVSPKQKKIHKK